MKMQIHRPQSLLALVAVVLMATLVRGVQPDSTTESGSSGATLKPPSQEVRNAGEASTLTQNAKERRALLRVWSSSGSHFILIED